MENPVQQALASLTTARESAQKDFDEAQMKLGQIEQAIKQLQNTILVVDHLPRRQDYAGMGIVEAARKWLGEVGRSASTEEIAKALLERGVTTKSKRFVPTVYATLDNSKEFVRDVNERVWDLKKPRGGAR